MTGYQLSSKKKSNYLPIVGSIVIVLITLLVSARYASLYVPDKSALEPRKIKLQTYRSPPQSNELQQDKPQLQDANALTKKMQAQPTLQALNINQPAVSEISQMPDYATIVSLPSQELLLKDFFTVNELDRMPRIIKISQMLVPSRIMKESKGGVVELAVMIDTNGRVEVIEVLSNTNQALISHAQRFAEKCVFEPPSRNGQIVKAYYVLPVEF